MKALKKISIQLLFIAALTGFFGHELGGPFMPVGVIIEFTDFHSGSEGKESEEKLNIEEYIQTSSIDLFQPFELLDKPFELALVFFLKTHHNSIWKPPEVF